MAVPSPFDWKGAVFVAGRNTFPGRARSTPCRTCTASFDPNVRVYANGLKVGKEIAFEALAFDLA